MNSRSPNTLNMRSQVSLISIVLACVGCGPDPSGRPGGPSEPPQSQSESPTNQVPLGPEHSQDRPYVPTERTSEEKQILKLFDEQLHQKLVEGRGATDRLDHVERAAICLRNLGLEVNNGGIHQYYFNSSGQYAIETPEVLKRIGARDLAHIVSEANSLFGSGGPSLDWEERRKQLREMDKKRDRRFDELTQRFYRVLKRSNLPDRFDDYVIAERIKNNP